jgi:hypothetical protein
VYAIQHLGHLIRASSKANEWTLRSLLAELYDPDLDIATLAMKYLDDACEDVETLELVKMQPTQDHLGDITHDLLLRCASRINFMLYHIGCEGSCQRLSASATCHSDYIDREIENWFVVPDIHCL